MKGACISEMRVPAFASACKAVASIQGICYGPLLSLKGSEPSALALKVVDNGVYKLSELATKLFLCVDLHAMYLCVYVYIYIYLSLSLSVLLIFSEHVVSYFSTEICSPSPSASSFCISSSRWSSSSQDIGRLAGSKLEVVSTGPLHIEARRWEHDPPPSPSQASRKTSINYPTSIFELFGVYCKLGLCTLM